MGNSPSQAGTDVGARQTVPPLLVESSWTSDFSSLASGFLPVKWDNLGPYLRGIARDPSANSEAWGMGTIYGYYFVTVLLLLPAICGLSWSLVA